MNLVPSRAGTLPDYTRTQFTVLVVLRMLIGWHFLYEGLAKLFNPFWTSAGYLSESRGLFSGIFRALGESSLLMPIVDFVNVWLLILIGLALLLGIFERVAATAGVVLLALYYLAAPPLPGVSYSMPWEGNYLLVNKTLIEMLALWVVALFPTAHILGLDHMLRRGRSAVAGETAGTAAGESAGRTVSAREEVAS